MLQANCARTALLTDRHTGKVEVEVEGTRVCSTVWGVWLRWGMV